MSAARPEAQPGATPWPPDGRPLPSVDGLQVEHVAVHARGLRFHVALAGPAEAEPLLLLHGWPQHWYEWRRVLPELAASRRCVMPDLRGLGWSDAPARGYEKETLAEDVLAVLDALGIESTDLIAHDWGGWTGFLIALRRPERLKRYLALNIVPPWPMWERAAELPRAAGRLARLWYQGMLATPVLGEAVVARTGFVRWVLTVDGTHRAAFSPADLEAFAEPLREPRRARASSLFYRDFLTREMLPVMRGRYADLPLTVPTRLLFGERDFALGGGPSPAALARAGRELTFEPVPDSGHFIAEERPDLVVAAAREHLGV